MSIATHEGLPQLRCLKAALHQLTAFHSSGASATGRAGLNIFHVEQLLLKQLQMRWHKTALATVYCLLQAGLRLPQMRTAAPGRATVPPRRSAESSRPP